jgi:hypothetical protein
MAIKVYMAALDSKRTNLQNAIEQLWVNHNLVCYKNQPRKTHRHVEGNCQVSLYELVFIFGPIFGLRP